MIANDISRLTRLERGELLVETGSTYDGTTPVRIRATQRAGRFEFSDDGGAVAAARVDPKRLDFPNRIAIEEYEVNVTRQGVVWLPGFARSEQQWLAKLPDLVAEGSLALYGALLELGE